MKRNKKKLIDMASMHFNYKVIAILTTINIMEKNIQVEIKQEKNKDYTDASATRTRLPLYSRSPWNH